jgi:hypothetical protein
MRLFRLYAEGNFIEAGTDTPFLQTGEAKYGKPILDLAVTSSATLEDATKCVLVSFDSTMISNLSVGMPIDLLCYARDSLQVTMRRRFEEGDDYRAGAAVARAPAEFSQTAAAAVVGAAACGDPQGLARRWRAARIDDIAFRRSSLNRQSLLTSARCRIVGSGYCLRRMP